MPGIIKTAYAYSARNHCYRARAFVREATGVKHSYAVAIGDTPEEAIDDCVRYIKSMHVRDGVEAPTEIENLGKLRGALVDAYLF